MRCQRLEFLLCAVAALFIGQGPRANECFAVEASPFPVQVRQPDGTPIELNLRGNEYLHWYEFVPPRERSPRAAGAPSHDVGYTVLRRADGAYVYAQQNATGQLEPTDLVVGKVQPRAGLPKRLLPTAPPPGSRAAALREREVRRPAAPLAGQVPNLVILMRFADHASRNLPGPEVFDVVFNRAGGDPQVAPTGSVRDVYYENSYGKLELRSRVVGWFTLPKPEKYYAAGESGLTARIHEAIKEALQLADPYVDFRQFDRTGDGLIDSIAFIHSGYAAEFGGVDQDGADERDRIWSHQWAIPMWSSEEGVKVRQYHIDPGLWNTSGTEVGRIGVICHETGHYFGLPDLYDTSGRGSGIGSWCLMANSWGFDFSQRYPPQMSAWCKAQLGWVKPKEVTAAGVYTIAAIERSPSDVFRISHGFPSQEYLLIENRQPIGFDQAIPPGTGGRGGLAIWHVDEKKQDNSDAGYPGQAGWPDNNRHYKVALLQADGRFDLSRGNERGDGDDVFRKGHREEITSGTVPNTDAYQDGNIRRTGIQLKEISASGNSMRFRLDFAQAGPAAVAASARPSLSPQATITKTGLRDAKKAVEGAKPAATPETRPATRPAPGDRSQADAREGASAVQAVGLTIGLNRVNPAIYGSPMPLGGCENDAADMAAIARASGLQVETLLNEQATRQGVAQKIAAAAEKLHSGDLFLICYAGHGSSVPDLNGDEEDGKDETWCLYDGLMLDDELHELWTRFRPGVRVAVFSDSCHSGTVTRDAAYHALQDSGFGRREIRAPMGLMAEAGPWSAGAASAATPAVEVRRWRSITEAQASAAMLRMVASKRQLLDALTDPRLGETRNPLAATVLLISGCKDNQYSGDGDGNGLFTATLKQVWNGGAFAGNYRQFQEEIARRMPTWQQPNYYVIGAANRPFEEQKPFQCNPSRE